MRSAWDALCCAWSLRPWKRRGQSGCRKSSFSRQLEQLELRTLLATYTLPVMADGIAYDRNLDGYFEGANGAVTYIDTMLDTDPEVGDVRGIFEFNMGQIPSSERITSVVLRLDLTVYDVPPGQPYSAIKLFAGIGDGFVTRSDVTTAETLVRDLTIPHNYYINPLNSDGLPSDRRYDIAVSPSWFQSQMPPGSVVTLMTQMMTQDGIFSANSKNNPIINGTERPQLIVTTSQVEDEPAITITVNASSLPEDAGSNATTLTITRTTLDLSLPMTVALTSTNTAAATVPVSVTIPAFRNSVTVNVNIIDDTLLDGTQAVQFIATIVQPLNGPGTPIADPTFGGENGIPVVGATGSSDNEDPGPDADQTYPKVIAQPDGKAISILAMDKGQHQPGWSLVRLNADGSYDSTFGNGGVVTTILPDVMWATYSGLTLQSDGKIVVAGSVSKLGATRISNWVVVRYNADGSLDNSFGTGGFFYDTLTPGSASSARSVSELSDGKLIVSGLRGDANGLTTFSLTRLMPDGTRDTSFGTNGIATFDTITFSFDTTQEMIIQPDDKILMVGSGTVGNKVGAVRFNADGSLDGSFGGDGFVDYVLSSYYATAESVALQPDGKIVIAARSSRDYQRAEWDLVVLRLHPDGRLDFTFSGNDFTDGFETIPLKVRLGPNTFDVAIQPDGRIVAGALALNRDSGSRVTPTLVRLLSNGTPDPSFGAQGIYQPTALNPFLVASTFMAFDWLPDGRLLTLAASNAGAYVLRFAGGEGAISTISNTLLVTDVEELILSLSRSAVSEGAGPNAVFGTVSRSNTDVALPLTVTLVASDDFGAKVPAQVTIPAGASSVAFPITLVDDTVIDPDQLVTITATATGYPAGTTTLLVTDNEAAGAIFTGDILVVRPGVAANSYEIAEYSPTGIFVHAIPIPWPTGARPPGQALHDLVQDQAGKIYLYNGTSAPFLSEYDPGLMAFAEQNFAGWSTSSNGGNGGIATFHQFVFASDSNTAGPGSPAGIVRFDRTDNSVVRLSNATGYQDLTIGLDRLLYALNQNQHIDVYDPVSLTLVRSLNLPTGDYRGLAVMANGQILAAGANGVITLFDANGSQLKTLTSGAAVLTDIDVEPGGRVIAGSLAGEVIITTTALTSSTRFTAGTGEAYVAFALDDQFPIPTVRTSTTPLTVLESDPPTSIDLGLQVSDDGNDLVGATVSFTSGYIPAADQLLFTNQNGIHGSFNVATGVLKLEGPASLAKYQAALRSVKYATSSDTPQASRTITLTVTDGINTATATRAIVVTPTNDPPIIGVNQAFSVAENAANNTPFGTVVAFDPDSTNLSNWSIVSGNTGGVLAINPATGVLRVADGSQLDFEARRSFTIGITVFDGSTTSAIQTVTILLVDQNDNAPTVRAGQVFSVEENAPNGLQVGLVKADDQDTVGLLQNFTIVSGNAAGIWSINPSTGALTVVNGTQLNFETTPTQLLGIQVSDGTRVSAVQTIQIDLVDGNDNAPVITPGQTFSVPENSAAITVAGFVVATDADLSGSLQSFTIVSGNNSGAWKIDPISGLITVKNSVPLDFETTPSFTLGITVSDGVQTSSVQTITIQLVNVNESPSLSPAVFTIAEEASGGLVVGSVQGMDPDAGQLLTYTVTAGSTGNKFNVNPNTGVITVANGATFDFETTPSYSFVVTVTDNGNPNLQGSAPVTIILTNGNDPPILTAGQSFTIAENSAAAAQVGIIDAHDPDFGQMLTYSIIGGNSSGAFAINPTTGRITVADPSKLDYEIIKTFILTVQVTDNGSPNLSVSTPVTISVTNVNETPTIVPATFSITENSPKTTLVGSVTGQDQDIGQSLLYTILSGNTGNAFNLHVTLGTITVNNAAAIDFETTPTFTLSVKIQDNGSPSQFTTGTITIHLTDIVEPPQVGSQTFHVDEGSQSGMNVGTVIASDPDQNLPLSYQIVDGDPNGVFSLNSETGQLRIADAGALDYESSPFMPLLIQVTKPGAPPLTTTTTVTVNVEDVNEAPQLGNANFSLNENSTGGATVGTVVSFEPDSGQTLTYAITAGNIGGAFEINAATGKIRVASGITLNAEAIADYVLTVQATDTGFPPLSNTAQITIHVNDLNEPPVLSDQTITVAEDIANGTVLATLAANNPEVSQQLTYSIIGGNANGSFAINPSTGQVTVLDNAILNFEDRSQLVLTIQVTDDGQPALLDTATLTIQITNVNEPPRMTSATFIRPENSPVGTVVGAIVAVDDDANQHTSYAITASDLDGLFAINSEGLVTIAQPNLLDFETHPEIHFTVRASDDGNPVASESREFTLQLTNVDEPVEIALTPGVRTLPIPVKPQALDNQARVRDVDSPGLSLASTTLQIKVIEGASSSDQVRLLKAKGGDLVVKGRNILYQGTLIAVMTIGKKGAIPLTLNFNASATQAGVEAVLQHIYFRTKGAAGSTRTLEFTLSGLAGGKSSKATKVVKLG